jgi:putative hydrolase of the HAD superfamily
VRLFDQIEEKMRVFVANFPSVSLEDADLLRAQYWRSHGTTVAGMMEMHAIPPHEFLRDVHDIDFSVLTHSRPLAQLITTLPGRKIVYTNGTKPYAWRVLEARGLEQEFESVYGIEYASYQPKPRAAAFHKIFTRTNVTPYSAAMFEDDPHNLEVPAGLGMRTIFISPDLIFLDYINMAHSDLETLLLQLVAACFSDRIFGLCEVT